MVERFAAPLADGARILDLGCGAGIPSTRLLARRFRVLKCEFKNSVKDLKCQ